MGDVEESGKYKHFQIPVLKNCTGGEQGRGEVWAMCTACLLCLPAWFTHAGEIGVWVVRRERGCVRSDPKVCSEGSHISCNGLLHLSRGGCKKRPSLWWYFSGVIPPVSASLFSPKQLPHIQFSYWETTLTTEERVVASKLVIIEWIPTLKNLLIQPILQA